MKTKPTPALTLLSALSMAQSAANPNLIDADALKIEDLAVDPDEPGPRRVIRTTCAGGCVSAVVVTDEGGGVKILPDHGAAMDFIAQAVHAGQAVQSGTVDYFIARPE